MFDRKTYMKSYFERNRGRYDHTRLKRNLKSLYGLTVEQYEKMVADQKGLCPICERHVTKCRQRLNVDHDHITGKIRGLLCGPCNAALGIFQDSVENLKRAVAYLEYNSSKNTRPALPEDVLRPTK